MKSRELLEKLASVVQRLPEADALQLDKILDAPTSRREFRRLLQAGLGLMRVYVRLARQAGAAKRAARSHKAIRASGSVRRWTDMHSTGALCDAVGGFLEDRVVFPSTRDVLGAVNSVLDSKFAYDSFRRSGRKPLIRKFLHRLLDMPGRERVRRIKLLFTRFETARSEADEYRDLFQVLTGHE